MRSDKEAEAKRDEEARKKQEREDKLAAEKAEAERKKQERAAAAEQKKKEREEKLAAEKAEAERKKQERAEAAARKKEEREQAGKEATVVAPVTSPVRPAAQIAAQAQGNAAERTEQLKADEAGKKGTRKPSSDKEAQVEQLDPHKLREAHVKETEKPQGAPSDRNATTVKKKTQAGAPTTKADQVERLANTQSERTGTTTTTANQAKPNPDVNRVEQLK